MSVVLDSGVLHRLCHPNAAISRTVLDRLAQMRGRGRNASVYIPEIADFEVRRELLRKAKTTSASDKVVHARTALARLDALCLELIYLPVNTEAMKLAAELWAEVRRQGKPTGSDVGLDADVILAAQALRTRSAVATANVRHFERFEGVDVQDWSV